MAGKDRNSTIISRYYIDTRTLASRLGNQPAGTKPVLPLLSTLPLETQTSVMKYFRIEDKCMSLASALLKHTYLHRTAKLPWSDIQISKTSKPHGRPYWNPPSSWQSDDGTSKGIEFNVSHQAGVVILAGCKTPGRPETSIKPGASEHTAQIRIGVDVACTKEGRRAPDLSTQGKLDEWVDVFSEMFSFRERKDMKNLPVPDPTCSVHPSGISPAAQMLEAKGRRFYTYWALKEAYIKMVGEGLLAEWLRRLEFVHVNPPDPGQRLSRDEMKLRVMFKGEDISDHIEVEVEGFEDIFLFAMITRGISEQQSESMKWQSLDIEEDIRPCAEGKCSCISS